MTVTVARLAQSVERQALNLMGVGSIPTVGVFDVFARVQRSDPYARSYVIGGNVLVIYKQERHR